MHRRLPQGTSAHENGHDFKGKQPQDDMKDLPIHTLTFLQVQH
jgi:hypothetical protein